MTRSQPDVILPPFQRITLIGLGLIGGSLAMAVRERLPDWQIVGVDPHADTLQYALKHRIIDQASLSLPTDWDTPQLVVLSAHLNSNLDTLERLAPQVQGKSVLVTDIGSCKRAISALGQRLLPEQFIPGHPMAGKEHSGIEHAASLLFAGKSYLFCPHNQTPSEPLEQLQGFVRTLGAIPKLIDADQHDRYMAYVSHLPQLYAILLTNLLYRNQPGHLLAYHGGGIDDQLRLAASPYTMWREIFNHNADHLRDVLGQLRGLIDEILPQLDAAPSTMPGSDATPAAPSMDTLPPDLGDWFARANQVHQQFHLLRINRPPHP